MHDNGRHVADLAADLNDAIDATARALTEGPPRAALREGVARRIAQRERSSWWLVWPAGAAAVAALVATVLLWPERMDVPVDIPVGRAAPKPRSGEGGSGSPSERNNVRPTGALENTVTRIAITEPAVAAEPIVVESIDVMPLDLDEIEVPPLMALETIAFEALTVE